MQLKVSSALWRPICLGLSVFTLQVLVYFMINWCRFMQALFLRMLQYPAVLSHQRIQCCIQNKVWFPQSLFVRYLLNFVRCWNKIVDILQPTFSNDFWNGTHRILTQILQNVVPMGPIANPKCWLRLDEPLMALFTEAYIRHPASMS